MKLHERMLLRQLVDATWQSCTESEEVPSTKHADELIDKVFNKPVPPRGDPERLGFVASVVNMLGHRHRPKPYNIGFDQGMHCADCKVMLPDNTPTHEDFK